MYSIETFKISGYGGEAVPNTFFRQRTETGHLAVLLPGLGYTTHMPIMYYPCLVLLAKCADVMRADYNYIKRADFMSLESDERRRWAEADALAVFNAAINQRIYNKITLVGKSIGTLAMGHLITTLHELPQLQCIWLTPPLKNEHLLSQIKRVKQRALLISGTSDPYYDRANLEDVLNITGGGSVIIENANHSLEIHGEPMKSLQALELVTQTILEFLH